MIWFWIGIIALCMITEAFYEAPIISTLLAVFIAVALFAT